MMNRNDHPHGLFSFLLTAVLLFTFLTQTVSAVPDDPSAYPTVPVYLDGHDTGTRAYVLEDGVTYMTLRGAAPILFPGAEITWDSKGGTASLKTKNLELTAVWGKPYITANGRYFALSSLYPAENKLVNGVTYIPLRLLARAAGADIAWNGSARRVEITGGAGYVLSGEQYYNADDLYWLSHIIYAEAGNQSLRGQLAVGAVIMNRVAHEGYPDSVYGVVYDRRFGVQFTPTANGTIRQIPSPESVIAAKLVLDGCRISEEALYFLDPDIATSLWVVRNCRALFTIEDHDFYA